MVECQGQARAADSLSSHSNLLCFAPFTLLSMSWEVSSGCSVLCPMMSLCLLWGSQAFSVCVPVLACSGSLISCAIKIWSRREYLKDREPARLYGRLVVFRKIAKPIWARSQLVRLPRDTVCMSNRLKSWDGRLLLCLRKHVLAFTLPDW